MDHIIFSTHIQYEHHIGYEPHIIKKYRWKMASIKGFMCLQTLKNSKWCLAGFSKHQLLATILQEIAFSAHFYSQNA